MAGHSKWAKVKHFKGAIDAKRGKIFSKLSKEISIAAKLAGGDPAMNPRLRMVLLKCRASNMPNDNIERAIKKGTGDLEGVNYVEVTYEGYGPGGVAILIHALTDNPTRKVADVRHRLSRGGGNLGATNSVAYMFERKGQIYIDAAPGLDADTLLEAALEAGAEDFATEGEQHIVTTEPTMLHAVKTALEAMKIAVSEAEITSIPKSTVRVEGKPAESLLKLLEELENLDDVQKVAANFDMDMAEMAKA